MINDVHGNLLKSSENGYRRCMKYFGDLMDLEVLERYVYCLQEKITECLLLRSGVTVKPERSR